MARAVLEHAGMGDYAHATRRLRALLTAHASLMTAIEDATEDVLRAAEREARDRGVGVASVMGTICMPAPSAIPPPPRAPGESGMRPRPDAVERALAIISRHERQTHARTKRIESIDVERYIAAKWDAAATDADREVVREMVEGAARSGSVDPDAAERLRALAKSTRVDLAVG